MSLHQDIHPLFKRALIISAAVHALLFILIILSPHFPKPGRKGLVHYVHFSLPGGSGGKPGGRQPAAAVTSEPETLVETEIPDKPKLRDLTIPEKAETQKTEGLRYPVEKPKKDPPQKTQKKAVIQQADPQKSPQKTPEKKPGGSGSGGGSGIRFATGEGSGGGSEYTSQVGLSNFGYTYYLRIIQDRISSSWYPSRAAAGIGSALHTTVQFRIYRNGRISDVDILEKSGVRAFDLIAISAVQYAAPFPPLPNEYEEDYLIIQLIFEHNQ